MALSLQRIDADIIGVWASSLCAVHCAVTPLLFAAHASVHAGKDVCASGALPWYWAVLDWAFLVFAIVAVYFAAKRTTSSWVKWGMWASLSLIALEIISEAFHLHLLGHSFMYVGAFVLICLHWYNHRQCKSCEPISQTE